MVTITQISTGTAYTPKTNVSVTFSKPVAITQIPIPLLDLPVLLNFGGATPSLTITFVTMNEADVSLLVSQFASASDIDGYNIDLTKEWGSTVGWGKGASGAVTGVVQGYVQNFDISQKAGEGQKWDVTITYYLGTLT